MRILIYGINYFPELTGIGKYTGEMANWLVECGHDVHVVTAPPYYPEWSIHSDYRAYLYKKENIMNVGIFRCPVWVPSAPSGFKRILHLMSFAISSFPVVLGNVFWRPDVVVAIEPSIFSLPGGLIASFLSRSKSWLHIQDYEIDAAFELGMIRSSYLRNIISGIEKIIMRCFSRISSISPNMVQRAIDKGVNAGNVVLFPNWVDTVKIFPMKSISPFRKELGISNDIIVALYSGNMGEKQGLELIIETAQALSEDESVRFIMCGSGAAYKRLRKLAGGLDNILWIPLQPLDRLNDLLNLADIHLLPQSANVADLVMPSKLTGILASGRPVVATALPGTQLADVIEGKGIVTLPGEKVDFIKAINYLIHSPEKRIEYGLAARKYATEYLDINAVMSKFESNLLEVINK